MKKALDSKEQGLNDRESKLAERETALDDKLKKAIGEMQKYRQLYDKERDSKSDLVIQLHTQKREAKRWEDNYNNLYSQHVQVKRSKGMDRG